MDDEKLVRMQHQHFGQKMKKLVKCWSWLSTECLYLLKFWESEVSSFLQSVPTINLPKSLSLSLFSLPLFFSSFFYPQCNLVWWFWCCIIDSSNGEFLIYETSIELLRALDVAVLLCATSLHHMLQFSTTNAFFLHLLVTFFNLSTSFFHNSH